MGQLFRQQRGHLPLFAGQQLIRELHQGNGHPKQGKTLGQLAANGAAAQHQQLARRGAQLPEGVGGEPRHLLKARQLGHQRPGAGGEHDMAAGKALAVHLHLPGETSFAPFDALHPSPL